MSDAPASNPGPNDPLSEPIMKFFTFNHLTPELAQVSATFKDVAEILVKTLPRNAERSTALRKLLEAKDCAVRAALP